MNELIIPTEQQLAVLRLLGRGYSVPEIAAEMWLSYETVKTHVQRLGRIMVGSGRHTKIITEAIARGWLRVYHDEAGKLCSEVLTPGEIVLLRLAESRAAA